MTAHETRTQVGPAGAGIGLRGPHIAAILETRPKLGWLEVHPENYMGESPPLRRLEAIRRDYPISLHGVGLSLGSAEGLDADHLARVAALALRIEAAVVSEHLSWSITDGTYLNDLLPLPYTEESLAVVTRNVAMAQDVIGRRILVENPSTYLRYRHSPISEPEFLAQLVARTDCGILCDVNNIYVTTENFDLDATAYLDALPPAAIGEIHLAGHHRGERHGRTVLIDDHASRVIAPVWQLYRHALSRFGPVPTMIEWDKEIPELDVLLDEARIADSHALAICRVALDARIA